MEIALEDEIPTYSGGLGVLAGDTIRSNADLGIPMVGVTLLYREGYFEQDLDEEGVQRASPELWEVSNHLRSLNPHVRVMIGGEEVTVRAWEYTVEGVEGHTVPIYFLDTNLETNSDWHRSLTTRLYGGDQRYRMAQEMLLGIGGVRMLSGLGHTGIERYHMNEGHASFLTLELLNRSATKRGRAHVTQADIDEVREQCIFTTHTPVPAGHDRFDQELVHELFEPNDDLVEMDAILYDGEKLNMTELALELSRYVNGVAKKHGEVSRNMFGGYEIDSITNGVHLPSWTSPPFKELFDRYIPGWEIDNFSLRHALSIPRDEIWDAHRRAKENLLDYVNANTEADLNPEVFTLGFARRAATYKRADLLFDDMDRLRRIAREVGPFQLVFSGKAHPADDVGQSLIRRNDQAREEPVPEIKAVYLEDYILVWGRPMTSVVDLGRINFTPSM
jgi:starch phosphorylase